MIRHHWNWSSDRRGKKKKERKKKSRQPIFFLSEIDLVDGNGLGS